MTEETKMLKRYSVISEMEDRGFIDKNEMNRQIDEIEQSMIRHYERKSGIAELEAELFD